jgi:hypothetical protein
MFPLGRLIAASTSFHLTLNRLFLLIPALLGLLSGLTAQDLSSYFPFPDSGKTSYLVFEIEGDQRRYFEKQQSEGERLIIERRDEAMRLVEYRVFRRNESGIQIEQFVSYLVDSAGNTIPVFAELEEVQILLWQMEDARLMRSWTESRRMDSRMAGLRVEVERILLPGTDTIEVLSQNRPVIQVNDLIRLEFRDRKNEPIGEDFILDFVSYAEGLGPVLSRRQFSDGSSRSEKLVEILNESDWERLTYDNK